MPGQFLGDDHQLRSATTKPVRIFRRQQARKSRFCDGGPHGRTMERCDIFQNGAALVEIVIGLEGFRQAFADQNLFFGEGKIHDLAPYRPSNCLAMMLR